MAVTGLNHITLAVKDVGRSVAFYRDLLGFALRAEWPDGAYLEAGSLWLCVSRDALVRTAPHPDYTHVALSVAEDAFDGLAARVSAAAPLWRSNRSEGASLYFLDPDGHKIELHVGTLASRLDAFRTAPSPGRVIYDP